MRITIFDSSVPDRPHRRARAATAPRPFNAVAEPRRRYVLEFLATEERAIGEIVDALALNQPSVSTHLRVLLDVALVSARAIAPHHSTRGVSTMTTTLTGSEHATIVISEEIHVEAPADTTLTSLLIQMGRQNETPEGKPLPMMLEPRPAPV
jgi:hypothetical protein